MLDYFATFNKSQFPYVYVDFQKNIRDYHDYKHFEEDWLSCYCEQEDFYFIFDTTQVGMINPKYCYHLTTFISKLKKMKTQYLKYSIIIVDNWYIKQLLFWVFQMQSPVAPVYIIEKKISVHSLIDDIHEKKIIKDDNIYVIYP